MIDLIPIGAENAVLLKDLSSMVGKSPRQVQADIQLLRDNGLLILSSASGGYYFPSADEKGEVETERYIAMMEGQALGRLKRLRAAKKWLRERGQMRITAKKEGDRKDNSVGKKTYDVWCPSAGGGQRKYIAHMGEGILEGLTISYADIVEKAETDAEPVETVIIEDVPEQPVQQTVNNPFVFNFNQYGNNGTQIGHVENYFGGKKKED